MIRMHGADSPTIASQAVQCLAELAHAARSGPVGAATILAHTAALARHLHTLAEYERHADEEVQQALDMVRAREAALAAGAVVPLPTRPTRHTRTGGTAA